MGDGVILQEFCFMEDREDGRIGGRVLGRITEQYDACGRQRLNTPKVYR